tara:strand:+ start:197 stop:427 length:231 start_codon:yes stop_codon:yes gene_type:complete
MIENSAELSKGQLLKVDLDQVKDRLSKKLKYSLENDPVGELVGFKMVDGNQFGLVLTFKNGISEWFFEKELSIHEG